MEKLRQFSEREKKFYTEGLWIDNFINWMSDGIDQHN